MRRAISSPRSLGNQPVRHRHRPAAGQRGAGRHRVEHARLYSGPQDEKTLEKITPGLDLVKDYGCAIIAKPMFWVMDQMHQLLGNWGWTIIAFTILIKLLFFPLSAPATAAWPRCAP
jgi:membrane protein insertase Oxa1/YidC/SpoIIIJ